MTDRNSPTARRRSRGHLLLIALTALPILAVGWFVVMRQPSSPDDLTDEEREIPPDVTQMPPGMTPDIGALGPSDQLVIQLVDPEDPSRVSGEITWDAVDPLANRRYAIEQPRARLFMKDGRLVHVQSDTALFYIPEGNTEPESGTFNGNVIVRVFEQGASPIDIDKDAPAIEGRTDSLSFDSRLGEVSTLDRVVIATDQVEFAGSDVRVILSELRGRLELLEVINGEYIRYSVAAGGTPETHQAPPDANEDPQLHGPRDSKDARTPKATGSKRPGDSKQPRRKGDAPDEHEDFYLAVFNDGVTVTQAGRTLSGDRLDVWGRLVDDGLVPGAIKGFSTISTARHDRATTPMTIGARLSSLALAQPAAEQVPPGRLSPPESEDDIILKWTGALVVRPLESLPEELVADEVAIRFVAPESGLVRFTDAETQATGRCASLFYGATSQDVRLIGPGPSSVVVNMPDMGRAEATQIIGNLGTGVGHIPGPGILDDTLESRRVSWTRQADWSFRRDGDRVTDALENATFQGDVLATDGTRAIEGAWMMARFETAPENASSLSRITVRDDVHAEDGRNRSLDTDLLDVLFEPAGNDDVRPTRVTAAGNIVGRHDGTTLTCDELDAELASASGDDDVRVSHAVLTGTVRFSREDGVFAEAERVNAWPEDERADLIGPGSVVGRDETRITASQISLDGSRSRLHVFGPGTFAHRLDEAGELKPEGASAQWTHEMTFEDSTGLIDCFGDAIVRVAPDEWTLDRVEANHVNLLLSPTGQTAADAPDIRSALRSGQDDERQILRALAVGSIEQREDGTNAQVESRRYMPDATVEGGRRLERLLYLEGPRIEADNENGTLIVPAAGRLLGADYRPEQPASDELSEGSMERGTVMFTWGGQLHVNRTTGIAEMTRGVKMWHQRLDDGGLTRLECEKLTAGIDGESEGELSAGDLTSLVCDGAVWLKSDDRAELIADALDYDGAMGVAIARANEGNWVTVFDVERATPVRARAVRWDLVGDQIERMEVIEPVTITTPR